MLIQYKIKTFSLIKAYNIAECFVKKYMTNYFFEEGFFSLHSSLSLFTLLLKYHAPEVYNVLDNLMILPEMYATGWIMTMLSSKSTLDVTYLLWDHIIRINDPLFFHFIMVAFLKSKGQIILQTDKTLIPSLMSSLAIGSIDELDSITTYLSSGGFTVFVNDEQHRIECDFGGDFMKKAGIKLVSDEKGNAIYDFINVLCADFPILDRDNLLQRYGHLI